MGKEIYVGKIKTCKNCGHQIRELHKKGNWLHTKYEPKEYRRYDFGYCLVRNCGCTKPEPKIKFP